jgi:hypothetical protein
MLSHDGLDRHPFTGIETGIFITLAAAPIDASGGSC